jgi:dinuclear metal center YbgI/SA1388 family protein
VSVKGVLFCLDATEAIVDEALAKGCNLIVAHHPIVFSGLKKLNGKSYIERIVIKAIKHDIAIYAIHTNLDHVKHGVNSRIAQRLGLNDLKILDPKSGVLLKLEVFVPLSHSDAVRQAVFQAGGGHIGNYDECSFMVEGSGTFRAGAEANPTTGEIGVRHTESEAYLQFVLPEWLKNKVLAAVRQVHPYEELAYQMVKLENSWQDVGAGMIGTLPTPMEIEKFLLHVKSSMQVSILKHTSHTQSHVQRIAICGGSGSFLLEQAKRAGADVFITADYKYHQFFDADGKLVIVDIGHFESEQFTIELLGERFKQKFPTFASHLTAICTNPVSYL